MPDDRWTNASPTASLSGAGFIPYFAGRSRQGAHDVAQRPAAAARHVTKESLTGPQRTRRPLRLGDLSDRLQ